MKLLASATWALLLVTALACSREKVPVQPVEAHSFMRSPKPTSAQDAVRQILGQVNDQQADQGKASGLGLEQADGSVEVPHLANTDYMVVTDSATYQQVLEAQGLNYSPGRVDFKREFFVLLIHPPVAFTGTRFLDGLQAEVEDDAVVRLTMSAATLPAVDAAGPLGRSLYDYQVSVYKLPRQGFSKARIVFKDQDDSPAVYVPL